MSDFDYEPTPMDRLEERIQELQHDIENTYAKLRQVEFAAALAAVASIGCFAKLMGWL